MHDIGKGIGEMIAVLAFATALSAPVAVASFIAVILLFFGLDTAAAWAIALGALIGVCLAGWITVLIRSER